jgi:hypothetical protein
MNLIHALRQPCLCSWLLPLPLQLVASLVVIAVATKWFGVAIPFLLIIYVFMQRWVGGPGQAAV